MKDLLERMETLIEVSRIPFRQAHDRLAEINQEHIEIARALLRADGERASYLMKAHFARTRDTHLRILLGRDYGWSLVANQK